MSLRVLVFLVVCKYSLGQPILAAAPTCFAGAGFDVKVGCSKASVLAESLLPCENEQDPGPCLETFPSTEEQAYTRNVVNVQEYNSMMSTAVSAEGGGFGYHVSTSVSYMTQSETTDRSVSFFIGQAGTTSTTSIRGVNQLKASPAALELLQQCESPTNCSFVQLYGMHYIDQIVFGRSFLGSYTMWDHSTSKSSALSVMASFSANEVFFSASVSASFQDSHSQYSHTLNTIANAKWLGGEGIVLNSSSPAGMYQTYLKWNATSAAHPAPMKMTFRNWIDLHEVQAIVNTKSAEVQMLFNPQQIADATTTKITEEFGHTKYADSAVNHALQWACGTDDDNFHTALKDLSNKITTHLTRLQTLDEAGILQRKFHGL